MIHMLQCLCGPARHAIVAILYDDKDLSPEDAKLGLDSTIELAVAAGQINRRCEICDKEIDQFWYEDGINEEQDFAKAKQRAKQLEQEQRETQRMVLAQRKGAMN